MKIFAAFLAISFCLMVWIRSEPLFANESASSGGGKGEVSGKNSGRLRCDLYNWKKTILEGDSAELRTAVDNIVSAPSVCLQPMLDGLEKAEMDSEEYDNARRIFQRAGIPMPVYSGWFAVPKLRKGEAPAHRSHDILESLLRFDEPRHDPLKSVYRKTVYLCGLVRGLSNMEDTSVAEPLTRFTFRRAGFVFREEVGRALENLRAYAVPGLLELAEMETGDWKSDRDNYLLQAYAAYMLTLLREGDPRAALAWADQSLKLELFEAYGKHRTAEAVSAVVDYTDAEDPEIRNAARRALERYFEGPRPRTVSRHLKLTGGRETKDRRLIFMNFRQRALHEVRAELNRLTAGEYRKQADGKVIVADLFREQDRRRSERDLQWFNRAVEKWEGGDREKAVQFMLDLLAREPSTSLGSKLAVYFHGFATSRFLEGRLQEAIKYLNMAYLLYQDEKSGRKVLSEIAYVRGLYSEARDAPLPKSFSLHEEALRWWGENEPARRASIFLGGNMLEPEHAWLLVVVAGAAGLSLLWLLGFWIKAGGKAGRKTHGRKG